MEVALPAFQGCAAPDSVRRSLKRFQELQIPNVGILIFFLSSAEGKRTKCRSCAFCFLWARSSNNCRVLLEQLRWCDVQSTHAQAVNSGEKGGGVMTAAKSWPVSSAPSRSCGFWGSVATIHTELNCSSQSQSTFSVSATEPRASACPQVPTQECWGPVHSTNIPRLPACASGWVLRVPCCIQQTHRSAPVPLNSHEMIVQRILSTAEQRFDYPS